MFFEIFALISSFCFVIFVKIQVLSTKSNKPFMKKLTLIFSFVILVCGFSFGNTNQYRVNDQQIETMFAQAQQVNLPVMLGVQDLQSLPVQVPPSELKKSSKDPMIAFLLAFFVGELGIHRLYLGTETLTFIGYLLTCGGCGIVSFVDWIVLLIGLVNDDIGKYVDNPKFFMW